MPLYKNKWEIKTWAQLSASVGDSTNALEFRPKHRLPYELQQGSKASKVATGFFNRDSILKSLDYPAGFYIYDTGSGLSYTAIPKTEFKSDLTNFLMSSSLSSGAKAQISSSFNGVSWPDLVVQIDSSSFTGSVTGSGPCTASWTVPAAFIGTGSGVLSITNTSTNATNIQLKAAGAYITGSIYEVEFTLPMETIKFTPSGSSNYLLFHSLSGSAYSTGAYESSSIYTPHAGTQQTSSLVNKIFGSGSTQTYANSTYTGIEHGMYLKALGDGSDGIYSYTEKHNIIQFPHNSTIVSGSYKIYAVTDTSKAGSYAVRTVYFVSGSSTTPNVGATGGGGYSGSQLFSDAALTTPANPGIYVLATGSLTGHLVPAVSFPNRIPVFSGQTY